LASTVLPSRPASLPQAIVRAFSHRHCRFGADVSGPWHLPDDGAVYQTAAKNPLLSGIRSGGSA